MNKIKSFALFATIFLASSQISAQSTFLPHNSHTQNLIERYEIRTGNFRNELFTDLRPLSREEAGVLARQLDTSTTIRFSQADRFNIDYLIADNLPWSGGDYNDSERPILRTFYRSKANLFHVNEDNFQLFINPGLYWEAGESNDRGILWRNTRAAEVRGVVDGKVGFYSFISENQIKAPQHEMDFFEKTLSYPGANFTKGYRNQGVDFFTAKGYITFRATPSIGFQFGQDKNFIGNGYRSLLLSDVGADYLFLKVNTRVWKFNYQNLFARMTDRYGFVTRHDRQSPYPAKYMASHYLSLDIFRNLNIGLFESVIFHDNRGDGRGFDLNYLNPIIFYRSIEHQQGDADKVLVGLNTRYLPINNVMLYGQFMLNEFRINDLRAGEGHWANKYGYQAGVKYVDVATISNLDLQIEYNRVRPYSYTHYAISGEYTVNSYTHYNQHLAHPLGANFSEVIAGLEYQPFPRVNTGFRYTFANYGADSSGSNWGQNIFLDYRDYERLLGNYVGQGVSTDLNILHAWVSYHLRHNLFLEVNAKYRKLNSEIVTRNAEHTFIGGTLRLNMARSFYDF